MPHGSASTEKIDDLVSRLLAAHGVLRRLVWQCSIAKWADELGHKMKLNVAYQDAKAYLASNHVLWVASGEEFQHGVLPLPPITKKENIMDEDHRQSGFDGGDHFSPFDHVCESYGINEDDAMMLFGTDSQTQAAVLSRHPEWRSAVQEMESYF